MGVNFIDEYSLLHFAVGIVAFFWGIPFKLWILLHISFEYMENTKSGMSFINNELGNIWPGGKDYPDSFVNSMLGDNFFATLGWFIAYYVSN